MVAEAVGALAALLGSEDAVARRNLEVGRQGALVERDDLVQERSRWEEGGLVEPEGPAWRSARLERPGAPLWRLVDVAPGVAATEVDGLEAALTGAGLLDAWVAPDGEVDLGDTRADVVLGVRPVAGRSLADLLVPAGPAPVAERGAVAAGVVAAVLASVAVATTVETDPGGDDLVVATDGTYRLGAAIGRGPRRPALLLGAVARERHRLERLAAVDALLADVGARLAGLERMEADLDRRRAAIDAELAAVPSGAGVQEARRVLRGLSDESRTALADLFGLAHLPAGVVRVRLGRLTEALGLAEPVDLRAGVESLRGPLPDRRAERIAGRSARYDLWEWLAGEAAVLPLGDAGEWAPRWVERLRAQGAKGGVDAHRSRLKDALRVLQALPADGVPLAAFADDLLGDPHGLDRGRSRAAIVLDAIAFATGAPLAAGGAAEASRRLWESVGVAPDPLSSTVLVLGLATEAPPPLGPWLAATSAAGEPAVLTLAQLRRWPVSPLPPHHVVYVVENPSLVAEAARLPPATSLPPLVCSSGRPTVAVVTLLRQLGAAGCPLRQHADFDPAGVSITAWLAEHAGTTPWRMSVGDYLEAAAARPRLPAATVAVPDTPWDPALGDAMRDNGFVVYEEELRAGLLRSMR